MLRQCYYKGRWYENLLVTEQGIVYRRDGDKLTELTHYYDGDGYPFVVYSMGSGGVIRPKVHRLVAYAFLPNVGGYYQEVDHINTNRTNCKASNLRWVTKEGNANNPITRINRGWSPEKKQITHPEMQRCGETNGNYGVRYECHCKKIMCIETGEVFDAIVDAANKYCINAGNIGRVCEGKRKTCGGYHWRYL